MSNCVVILLGIYQVFTRSNLGPSHYNLCAIPTMAGNQENVGPSVNPLVNVRITVGDVQGWHALARCKEVEQMKPWSTESQHGDDEVTIETKELHSSTTNTDTL